MRELGRFRAALEYARAQCSALEPWLQTRGYKIVKYLDDWADLVAVCAYFDKNPRPHCFPRQVPVGHTKFIENRTGILREMLDATLGNRVADSSGEFSERFGLLADPPLVRFRFLDPSLQRDVGWPVTSSAVPLPLMAELAWRIPRVIVVENRDVFRSLPSISGTLGIFGSGKAAAILSGLPWLSQADIVYWGDCDEAGFGMLAGLRSQLPQVRSVLLDDADWERWRHLAFLANVIGLPATAVSLNLNVAL
ncbi:MAG: Wadjet anti-phage system protein JetD domain-containing protein [bacterium]